MSRKCKVTFYYLDGNFLLAAEIPLFSLAQISKTKRGEVLSSQKGRKQPLAPWPGQ